MNSREVRVQRRNAIREQSEARRYKKMYLECRKELMIALNKNKNYKLRAEMAEQRNIDIFLEEEVRINPPFYI